ncbi:MAG: hypothetical protein ACTSPV_07375 [Candidatus Hodarchaeales archaeon]
MSQPDVMCEISCKYFRCNERYLKIVRKGNQKIFLCRMVEGDECIGYKCKFAFCSYRPAALDIETGRCSLKTKRFKPKKVVHKQPKTKFYDDPLKYSKLLDKKMKKNFKLKDYF